MIVGFAMCDGGDDAPEQVEIVSDVNCFVAETFGPEIVAHVWSVADRAGLAADVESTTADF